MEVPKICTDIDKILSILNEKITKENLIKLKFSQDCQCKIDMDGNLYQISSRIYPPFRFPSQNINWFGSISVYNCNDIEDTIFEKKFENRELMFLCLEMYEYAVKLRKRIKIIIVDEKEATECKN